MRGSASMAAAAAGSRSRSMTKAIGATFRVLDQIDGARPPTRRPCDDRYPDRVARDGRRACDLAARAIWTSLAAGFSRCAAAAARLRNYDAANRWAQGRRKRHIAPAVGHHAENRPGRSLHHARAQSAIHEAHPELVFMRLNGGAVLPHGKKTQTGARSVAGWSVRPASATSMHGYRSFADARPAPTISSMPARWRSPRASRAAPPAAARPTRAACAWISGIRRGGAPARR